MSLLRGLLRLLAFVFNIAAGFFLFAVGLVGSLAGEDVHFPLVPVSEGETLKWTLIGLGLFAIWSPLCWRCCPRNPPAAADGSVEPAGCRVC